MTRVTGIKISTLTLMLMTSCRSQQSSSWLLQSYIRRRHHQQQRRHPQFQKRFCLCVYTIFPAYRKYRLLKYSMGAQLPLPFFSFAPSSFIFLFFPVASLGWVTPGAATEGVTPLFFPEKPGDFFSRQFCGVTPDVLFAKTDDLSFAHRFIAFYCFHSGVTPSRVSPYTFFLPV